ncbi:MDR family oxidoreductase [Thalassospira xiamenensis]|uniref:Acryloyl-CoA reductase n=1 Tax=Thalassospira xiamenensis TaxID=220697 RepID=A0A367XI54_9PROT|nr:MDR family oxidoreductase [Thalassospira xiamenensis]KZB57459.1 acryloyl-CoA reductase [Thalassospira xiamenensis]RCK52810.1 acryloyl-CoA reductase [Thalassospira xiamenensis]
MKKSFRGLVLTQQDKTVQAGFQDIAIEDLPEGEVLVRVDWSTLNYKDGMVLNGLGRLVRQYPHVPGVDFAGEVISSDDPRYATGDQVILTGWRVGEAHWGGYAQYARVNADWLVPMPDGLDGAHAMAIGTAGFTSMLAVMALEEQGLSPDQDGEVLVTGAAGGVGSVAVSILENLGYRVAASTGRADTHDYLRGLGATSIIDRAALTDASKPLLSERWLGAIDSVGSTTLAHVLSEMKYHGVVAACGLAGGPDLPATVIPFLLRGVRLIGIDSVMCPYEKRVTAWKRLAQELPMAQLDAVTTKVGLRDILPWGEKILKGQVRGRLLIDVQDC